MEFNVAYVSFSRGCGFSLHLRLRRCVVRSRLIFSPSSGELQAIKVT